VDEANAVAGALGNCTADEKKLFIER